MSAPAPPGARAVLVARLLVLAQFALLLALVVLPAGRDWVVPPWLAALGLGAIGLGLVVMGLAGTALGRGLTPVPLPNRHATLRTGGLYRWVRHPIYAGLLLAAAGLAVRSGNWAHLGVLATLVVLLNGKARFEERHLVARFPGYAAYAAATPRFVPGLGPLSRRRFPRN